MINAYITKREAPPGYVAVTRKLAQALYDRGYAVILCGAEVNSYNVIHGEHRGYEVLKATSTRPFPLIVYDYLHAIPQSLGKVCVYYAKSEEAHQVRDDLSRKDPPPATRRHVS